MTLTNDGDDTAFFMLRENDQGFIPALNSGSITWLWRSSEGVLMTRSDSGAVIADPGSYRYTPENPSKQVNILVYTDDWIHTVPNTLVQQALTLLSLPATVHVEGDYYGFENDLQFNGPWDLVIYSSENYYPSSSVKSALLTYLQIGGKLAATEWTQQNFPSDPLWAEMGFR